MKARSLLISVLATLVTATGLAAPAAAEPVAGKEIPAASTSQAPWHLISGQLIYSSGSRCTLGFNATRGTGRYLLTAGHCTAGGGSWYGVGGYIGPVVGSSFPSNDYGLIQVASTSALSTPLVDRYSSGSDVTVTGTATPPVGSSVCYSSPASGWRCGTVTGVNQTVCYPQGCVNGLIRTSLCPAGGASGAPVVTNPGSGTTVRAVGLIAGGSGNCSSGGSTWVQPIGEPLAAYGLTLVTG